MAGYSHCIECGRRLRNAFFCPNCPQAACSPDCLGKHSARHQAAAAVLSTPQEDNPERPGKGDGKEHGPDSGSAGGPEKTKPRVSAVRSGPAPV